MLILHRKIIRYGKLFIGYNKTHRTKKHCAIFRTENEKVKGVERVPGFELISKIFLEVEGKKLNRTRRNYRHMRLNTGINK